jgi:hypothetical protein
MGKIQSTTYASYPYTFCFRQTQFLAISRTTFVALSTVEPSVEIVTYVRNYHVHLWRGFMKQMFVAHNHCTVDTHIIVDMVTNGSATWHIR